MDYLGAVTRTIHRERQEEEDEEATHMSEEEEDENNVVAESERRTIIIEVVGPTGNDEEDLAYFHFKIKKNTKMLRVFTIHAQRMGVDPSSLCYLLDGEPISPEDTAVSLGLEEDDRIDCTFAPPTGGFAGVILDQVPDDILCSICMALPIEPVITPCEHIFCKGCISRALGGAKMCPLDRRACDNHQLLPLQGVALRIWSSIRVKCGNPDDDGCAWTGSISDYAAHEQVCGSKRRRRDKVASLEEEIAQLKNELHAAKSTISRLESREE